MEIISISSVWENIVGFVTDPIFWLKALQLVLSLSILVFIHELGHYSWARIFGIKVEKFYLFFNPGFSIFKWKPKSKYDNWKSEKKAENADETAKEDASQSAEVAEKTADGDKKTEEEEEDDFPDGVKPTWRDTVYGLGWLPLGGYCAIAGMIDETQGAEALAKPAKTWEFRSKAAWKRLLVMFGGVLNNFLLALIIYAGIVFTWGEQLIPMQNATAGYDYSTSAHKIGFVDGDIPLTADGEKLEYLDGTSLQKMVVANQVVVLRDSQKVSINIPKDYVFTANAEVEKGESFIVMRMPVVVEVIQPGMGAAKAKLQKGDHLTAVNGKETPSYKMFTDQLQANAGKTVEIALERGGKPMTVNAEVNEDGKLGFQLADPTTYYTTIKKEYNIFESIPRGISLGWERMCNYVSSLKLLFTKQGVKSVGSFGAIGSMFPETWDWNFFWNITAFLSIILAVMNILPIPALDGGHIVFLLIEIIFRKKFSIKAMERFQTIGFFLLIMLMLLAIGNDVYRFVIQ